MTKELKFKNLNGTTQVINLEALAADAKANGKFQVRTKDDKTIDMTVKEAKEVMKSKWFNYLPTEIQIQIEGGGGGGP
jgi:hypothetical protein